MLKKGAEKINGFLDKGVSIKGELHFTEQFRIDGTVNGKIISEHHLIVGEGAEVDGEINVGHATLAGTVRGVVKAKERLEILKGGKVYAELHTPILVIEEGAFFEGSCNMNQKGYTSKKSGADKDSKDSETSSSAIYPVKEIHLK